MPIFLKHIEGGKADQVESFDKDQVRLGRQSDNDVKFDPQKDIYVSGYHAEIYRDGQSFFIKDLQSKNGTFVNSRKIDQPVSLKEGDTIQLSTRGPKLVFSTRDPSLPSETPVMASEPGAPALVSPIEEKPQPERKATIREHIYRYLPIGLSVAALLALVGVGRYLSYSWWALLVGAAATLLITGGAHLAWRFWQRRKALRQQKEVARQEREASLGRAITRP